MDLYFINIPYGKLLRLKYQMDKIVFIFLFLCLLLNSLFFIDVQFLHASCSYTSFIMAVMNHVLSDWNNISLNV